MHGLEIVGTTDRHYGNFGFMRDINTLKFIKPAPIFDTCINLWCDALNKD